ncbi:hypothetical protein [Malikia sp.]|uniref:hypothetical protein n=1 Tax=Malikia sp. TaxID=2070706 RepID=UPI002622D3F6|nr:hypothetical protein [Malikia sp.]MDD2727658.1 hypothetical protein [Malikia sp.]
MKRVQRPELPHRVAQYLERQQQEINRRQSTGMLNIDAFWKGRRATKTVGQALKALQKSMGPTEPCMYCVDNHGTDVEHFWPKGHYPGRAFDWANWLLCCTECGRIKGVRFPLDQYQQPLLIDPTIEDPWDYMDFDPDTGNLVARFDLTANDWMTKGVATVDVLQLDRREALAERYHKTFRHLCQKVTTALQAPDLDSTNFIDELLKTDDHGLLPWCINGAGQFRAPFDQLRAAYPQIWGVLRQRFC